MTDHMTLTPKQVAETIGGHVAAIVMILENHEPTDELANLIAHALGNALSLPSGNARKWLKAAMRRLPPGFGAALGF